MDKKCYKCKNTKSYNDFNKDKCKSDGLQSVCRECQREYDKKYYKKIDKDKRTVNVKARSKRIKEWLEAYKKTQCCLQCCNTDFRVLEFHHHNGDKSFNIGEIRKHGCGVAKILSEIQKCQCLCANCHRIITYEERRAKSGLIGKSLF